MTTEIDKFTPRTETPPPVEIEISEPIPTDSEVERMLKEDLGMVQIGSASLKIYQKFGVHQKGHGIIATQRGRAFVCQSRVDDNMRILHTLITDRAKPDEKDGFKNVSVEDVCALSRELTTAAKALTASQELMLSMEDPGRRRQSVETPPVQSFPAGAIVAGGNSQVHIHNPPVADGQKSVAGNPVAT
jgi:hypothetical protein